MSLTRLNRPSRADSTRRVIGLIDALADDRFDRITRLARRLFDVEAALIVVNQGPRLAVVSVSGLYAPALDAAKAFSERAMREGATRLVPDARRDPAYQGHTLTTSAAQYRFLAAQPLWPDASPRTGALCLFGTRVREIRDEDLSALRDLARFAENELDVIQLHQELALRRA